MSVGSFDLEALIRAIVISLAVGLIVGSISFFAMRKREERSQWKPVIVLGTIGVMLLLTLGLYYAWPSLTKVPSLDGLSQAEAEDLLTKQGLVPQGRPQYATGVEPGRVVPHSQSPGYGLPVRPGTVVTFAISVREEAPQVNNTPPPSALAVTIFQPKAGEQARCSRGADGVYKFSARGTSAGLSTGGYGLLLWVRPVNPPSDTPGWYLQRPPANGIAKVEMDGSWSGVAQLGNVQYPPHEGDVLDLAVTVADKDTVNKLLAEPGVVVRMEPVGIKSDTAPGVVATLK
jgi:hypothetical protein